MTELRIMTWNAGQDWENRLDLLAEPILRQDIDVIAIMSPKARREVDALADRVGMKGYFAQGNHGFGIAILSRLPVQAFEDRSPSVMFHGLVEAVIDWSNTPVHVFATHLTGYTPDSAQHRQRVEEAAALVAAVRPQMREHVLVVGDFNAARPRERLGEPGDEGLQLRYYQRGGRPAEWYWRSPSQPYARRPIQLVLDSGLVDTYFSLHRGEAGHTLWADWPWVRIDYIFATRSMASRLRAADVLRPRGGAEASHHFPVWAAFG